MEVIPFATALKLAKGFCSFLENEIDKTLAKKETFSLALSGGNTPKLVFETLASDYSSKISWSQVHFFWGDERCVPPGDEESNYGLAKRFLFDRILLPEANIHRISGEKDPLTEAQNYSTHIKKFLPLKNGLPVFDMVMLGLGEDGHTASLFPDRPELMNSKNICEVVSHPVSGQKRISLTGTTIQEASKIIFLVSGSSKQNILRRILEENVDSGFLPAKQILRASQVILFCDQDAMSPK